jgi:uncharacterized membrane protein YfcA
MDYLVVGAVALVASGLTLISGFGLGTILLPAFALFFSLPAAVALTAGVHLLNNLFKLALVGTRADRKLVLAFGLPAMAAALVGAALLGWMSDLAPIAEFKVGSRVGRITPMGLAVGTLMIVFALFEILPSLRRLSAPAKWLPIGGAMSGFVGGVSGHQGALRSAFLLRFRGALTHESYIATNVVIAVLVDVGRIAVYGATLKWSLVSDHLGIAGAATAAAFAGAWLGARLIPKITLAQVQVVVAVLLVALGVGVGAGLLGNP